MGFYPELWGTKTLEQMKKELESKKKRLFSYVTDYTPLVLGKSASGYHGPKISKVDAVDMPIDLGDFVSPTKSTIDINFDQKKGVPQIINDIDNAQTNLSLLDIYSANAKDGLLDAYEYFIMKLAYSNAGAKVNFADDVNDVLTFQDFRDARAYLNDAEAPENGRVCVIGPNLEDQLFDIPQLVKREYRNDLGIPEGVVGNVLGFEVVLYSKMVEVTTGGNWTDTPASRVRKACWFMSKLALGFARQKEFGAKLQPAAGIPGDYLNIYSVFGGTEQQGAGEYIYTKYANTNS